MTTCPFCRHDAPKNPTVLLRLLSADMPSEGCSAMYISRFVVLDELLSTPYSTASSTPQGMTIPRILPKNS